jgi:hypothetical protein
MNRGGLCPCYSLIFKKKIDVVQLVVHDQIHINIHISFIVDEIHSSTSTICIHNGNF